MKTHLVAAVLALALAAPARAAPPAQTPRGKLWWADIAALADDATQGRQPGSPGFDLAAAHVVKRFKSLGLEPAGDAGGFVQTIAFQSQTIDHDASTAALVAADGSREPLAMGVDLLVSPGGGAAPAQVDAPLVFIG